MRLAGPLLRQRAFLNVIKYLRQRDAIQIDVQLANRFEPAVVPRWTMDEDYLRLLASFELALPLEHRLRVS
jgi:hypothetical protein